MNFQKRSEMQPHKLFSFENKNVRFQFRWMSISIAFGKNTYSSNRDKRDNQKMETRSVEILIFDNDGNHVKLPGGSSILAYFPVTDLPKLLYKAQKAKSLKKFKKSKYFRSL